MDLLIVALVFVFLWKIEFKKDINKEYLSIKTSQGWKGFFALVVIYHHLSQNTVDGVFFRGFTLVGYLAVAIFFFLSGYGMQKKNITDDNYNKTFLMKRMPTILIPYIIITILYWGLLALGGEVYSFLDILMSIVKGKPIAKYSWYIINIIFLYLSFYVLMKIIKKNHKYMILGAILLYVMWTCLCMKLSFGVWWYSSTQLFVVGIIWATYEQRIVEFIKAHFNIISIVMIIAFAMSFLLDFVVSKFIISLILKETAAVLFTILVLLFSMKFQIGNSFMDFFGKISFELYLTHGLFVILCGKDFLGIDNNLLYSISILFLTIIFSFAYHKLCKFLLIQYNKVTNDLTRNH